MWNNSNNNSGLKYPKIAALQALAHQSLQMRQPDQFHQLQPNNLPALNPMAHTPPNAMSHVQTNAVAPAGHATAEATASQNPERFLSIMKNAGIKRNKGVAF